jgi:rubrerythrin
MPNSLRCKIKHLCHNGTLTERERDRILKALEQEPCEDAISRQAVLIELDKYLSGVSFDEKGIDVVIKELPPVSPQPKMGRWSHDGSHWKNRFICSECGYKLFDEPTSYCPNCGAKMAESEEKE